jgi:hypothetical protein
MFGALIACALAFGCKKEGGGPGPAALERPLIAGAASGPAGYQWRRTPPQAGVGSVELPTGEGWTNGSGEITEAIHEKLDITVILGTQPDVGADSRTEYMQLLAGNNKRGAPKYEVLGRRDGQINQRAAALLDGTFDNGTAYVTRDYVVFANQAAFVIMVRGPVARTNDVRAIADHVAMSFQ